MLNYADSVEVQIAIQEGDATTKKYGKGDEFDRQSREGLSVMLDLKSGDWQLYAALW